MMKNLTSLAIRLYPQRWRERYGEELEALLEDSGQSGPFTLLDILKGALSMQFRTTPARNLIGAFGAVGIVAGAALWLAIPQMYRSTGAVKTEAAVTPARIQEAAAKVLADSEVEGLIARHHLVPASVELVKRRIAIRKPTSNGGGFTVSFDSADAATAQSVTREVLDNMARHLGAGAELADLASLPRSPLYPAPLPTITTCALAFLLLGGIVALVRRFAMGRA